MTAIVDLLQASLSSQAQAVARREVSAVAMVEMYLERVSRFEGQLNTFATLDAAGALRAAEHADARLSRGAAARPLEGVVCGVKDNTHVAGLPTRFGSSAFGSTPQRSDDPVIARLRAAGVIVLGKTTLPELGMHSATHSETFGVTRNPWNPARTPGGSSGGSAAAVAAGLVATATGSDSGGSIRTPAAYCGLVGLKPTTGLVPRRSGGSVLSSLGFLTRSVGDTACLLDLTVGVCSGDRHSMPAGVTPFSAAILKPPPAGLRIAWSEGLGFAPIEPEVAGIARAALERLLAGASLTLNAREINLPNIYRHWVIDALNFAPHALQADGVDIAALDQRTRNLLQRFGHGDGGAQVDAARAFDALEREAARLFSEIDILATPATACAPFAADGEIPDEIAGRDALWSGAEPLSMFVNVLGAPAVSLPAGLTREGLPVGLQLVARRCEDASLLQLARTLEQVCPWAQLVPSFAP